MEKKHVNISINMNIKESFSPLIVEVLQKIYKETLLKEMIFNDNDIFLDFISTNNISSKDFENLEAEIYKHLIHHKTLQHCCFKILSISQIKKENELCQRLIIAVFNKKEDLEEYLQKLQDEEDNDHRNLNDKLHLFCQLPITKGNVLFLNNGALLFNRIVKYLDKKYEEYNYYLVKTPIIFQPDMWNKTGHMDKYRKNIFITEDDEIIKPMNCPAHMEIFNYLSLSYRQLPLRIGEVGYVHRKEETGGLQGLKRCRGFHIDDGHIFVEMHQIKDELHLFFKMLNEIYKDFGFKDYKVYLTTRPENSIGDDNLWEKAEQVLMEYLKEVSLPYILEKGEGAFYGPKLEIRITEKFTLGTIQIDFFLPQKLNITYVNKENTREHPIVLHRAVLGSLERFMGFLMEYHKGHLPIWLSPITVMIIPLVQNEYVTHVLQQLKEYNVRINFNDNPDNINNKIKKAISEKIPYIIVIGEQEVKKKTLTLRLNNNQNITLTIEEFIQDYIIANKYNR